MCVCVYVTVRVRNKLSNEWKIILYAAREQNQFSYFQRFNLNINLIDIPWGQVKVVLGPQN